MALSLTKRADSRTMSIISLVALIIFLPLLLFATYEAISLVSRAAGTAANIIVDTSSVAEPVNTSFFHAFAQGGEEATNMLTGIQSDIKALRPRLIRLDHIYDLYSIVSRSGEQLAFDWGRLDSAVDTILATGATPLLTLSFMPPVIAQDGNVTNPPNNWDEWALVVQKTIEHYSGRSEKNIAGIYYEVWNEPDLPQFGKWRLGGEKNYLTLYRYAARGAQSARGVNRFFLGGPATTGLYERWIMALVTSGYRLDFLSWHTYDEDPKKFDEDQRSLISWLLPYPNYTLIPKLITEFGFSGNKSRLYASSYAAAHTAAVIRQVISGGPMYLFSFQLKDGPGQESGDGWGLLTHETNGKRAKPRYYVYNFLDSMAGNRLLVTGEGSWVTSFATLRDGTIRVLLVNFDKTGNHVETVPVTLTNLEPGTYALRERFLFGKSLETKETITGQTLTKQVYMPAQSIALLELAKE